MPDPHPSLPANVSLVRIATLLIGIACLCAANGLQNILLPLRGETLGFSRTMTGFVMGSYYVGLLIAARLIPTFILSAGYVRTFAALASFCSAAVLVYVMLPYVASWLIVRFAIGFCMAGVFVVAETWVNEVAEQKNRGTFLASYMATVYLGLACGQFLLLVASPENALLFFVTSILISLSTVPMLLFARYDPPPPSPERSRLSFMTLWKATPLGCVATPFIGGIYATLFTMIPVSGASIGLPYSALALGMGLMIATGAIGIIVAGRLSDRVDRRIIMFICTIGSGACFLTLFTTPLDETSFVLLMAATGSVALPIYPILLAHIGDRTANNRLAAVATTVLLNGIGATLGPLMAGIIMDVFSASSLFLLLFALCIIVAVATAARKIMDWTVIGKKSFDEYRHTNAASTVLKPVVFNRTPRHRRNTDHV